MDSRTVALIAVAVIAAACILPAMADDSDAAVSERMSNKYVYDYGTHAYDGVSYGGGKLMTFVEGSDNHKAFQAYLADPKNVDCLGDDDVVSGGDTVHYYIVSNSSYVYLSVGNDSMNIVSTLEPYRSLFTVKGGDTITITLTSATRPDGESVSCELNTVSSSSNGTSLPFGQEVSKRATSTATYCIKESSSNFDLYMDVTYTIEGISTPSGSGTGFAAACFVIAALAVGLVIVASLKPKWSK